LVAANMGALGPALAATKVRQGYQTNIWGMPTYYLVQSGLLQKHGLEVEEFPVPSGNLTMQQMVARQVDLGTYAGPSFMIGNDKGGLIAIAVIENVGRTARVMARADAGITKMEDLKGKKVANQTGSSTGVIFVDQVMPKYGLMPGDYEEIRTNVNDMVAAMAANTVDAMVNVEPYNSIAEAEGIAVPLVDFFDFDKLPVFMAATPEFLDANPDATVEYLKAWLEVANDFKQNPDKVAEAIFAFYADKGYNMSQETLKNALAKVEVDPGWPDGLEDYMTRHAEVLVKAEKLSKMPDLGTAFRKDFMEKAMSS
jgi:ABC-type nitrate/sulfonate/bicarbonate transport system substrate-binding protein